MPNLSQIKRQRMMAFLEKIKEEHKGLSRYDATVLI